MNNNMNNSRGKWNHFKIIQKKPEKQSESTKLRNHKKTATLVTA